MSSRFLPLLIVFVGFVSVSRVEGQTPAPASGGAASGSAASEAKAVKLGTMQVQPPPGLALFNQALAATKAGKYAEAERLYKSLVRQQPDAAAAWANLALLQGRRGAYADAAKSMGKASQISPKTATFAAQQSSFALRAGQNKEAERAARKALTLEPKNVIALGNLGDLLFQQKRFAEAVPVLRTLRAVEGKQANPRTEIGLTLSLGASGQYAEALALARQRAQRLPREANAQLLHGDIARMAGNADEARIAYQKAATLAPDNPSAKAAMAYMAVQRGDRDETRRLIQERLKKTPNDPRLHFQMGYSFYGDDRISGAERFAKARIGFLRAATLEPKNPLYVTYTGIAAMMQGAEYFKEAESLGDDAAVQGKRTAAAERYKEAESLLTGALTLNSKYTLARMGLANIAEQSQKYKEAETQYRAILAYAPKDKDARRSLAGLLYITKRHPEAFAEMETLAAQYPTDSQTLSELASWQYSDGKIAETQKTYERVLQRDPNNVPALIASGRLQENLGRWGAAQKYYADALQRDPKNATAALLRGQLLVEQKKPDEAIGVYRKTLDADPTSNVVRWQLALLLRDQKRFDESLAEMQAITLSKTDKNRVMYVLGAPRLLMEQQKYPEAVSELTRLRRENPDDREIGYTLAEAQEKAGLPDQAEKTLTELAAVSAPKAGTAEIAPPDARPLVAKAGLYERANKIEDAGIAYEDALRLDSSNVVALQGLSRVRQKQGKSEMASAFLEELALSDAATPSLAALGGARQLHLQTKTTKQFVEFTKRLIEKYPDNRDALYTRARILTEETADYKPDDASREEAVALYDKILKKDFSDRNAQLKKAQQLETLGKKDDAMAAYRAVQKTDPNNSDANAAISRLTAAKGK